MDIREASAVATAAALFADRTRATILLALAGAGPHTVTDLAATAGVSTATASVHLKRLQSAGLVASERSGRVRHHRLRDAKVADTLAALAEMDLASRPSRRASPLAPRADRLARTCYDHLAGRLGVGMTDALLQQRLLSPRAWSHRATKSGGYGLTRRGADFFRGLGVELSALRSPTRAFAHPCLDRTERRPHVGGALGAAIAGRLEELGWIKRLPRTRAVEVTRAGRAALRSRFGVDL